MSIVWTILIGLAVALALWLLLPGRDSAGLPMTALLGISGALLAKYMGESVGWYREGETAGLLASLAGAIIFLAAFRLTNERTKE